MKLSDYEKKVLYQCKEILEIDITSNLNSLKEEINDNPEDPFNSRVYVASDIVVSHIISVLKQNKFYVEDRLIKGRNYPIVYTPNGKTAFMIYKTATIKNPNQFVCEISGNVNGLNGEKNTSGQLNLLNNRIERNQDFKDNNSVFKYLGHNKEALQQFLILNYSLEFDLTKMFVNEYNGAGELIDKIEINKPINPTDNFLGTSNNKNPFSNPIVNNNGINLKLKDINIKKPDKGV